MGENIITDILVFVIIVNSQDNIFISIVKPFCNKLKTCIFTLKNGGTFCAKGILKKG